MKYWPQANSKVEIPEEMLLDAPFEIDPFPLFPELSQIEMLEEL
jgi:hypothetical protein